MRHVWRMTCMPYVSIWTIFTTGGPLSLSLSNVIEGMHPDGHMLEHYAPGIAVVNSINTTMNILDFKAKDSPLQSGTFYTCHPQRGEKNTHYSIAAKCRSNSMSRDFLLPRVACDLCQTVTQFSASSPVASPGRLCRYWNSAQG